MTDKTDLTKPIGVPGLPAYGGRIQDEYDQRLKGDRLLKTYTEMGNDPTIRSFLFAFDVLARAAGHRIEPADESPAAKESADFAEHALDDMEGAWGDTLSEVLTCLQYGFSLFETVYKRRDDGRVGWARWAPRAQETIFEWLWDDEWNVIGVVQIAPPGYQRIEIPIERLIHFRVQPRKQNPMGTSLLRAAYDPWYFTKHIQKIEAIGVERDLAGLPVIGVPLAAYENPTQQAAWMTMGGMVRRDEQATIVMPNVYDDKGNKQYTVDLLSTGGARQIDTDPILARYERKMLRAVLADFLTLGDTGKGSYALSVNRSDLFNGAAKALLSGIEDVINHMAVQRLMELNGIAPALWPRFVFNETGRRDQLVFAQTLQALATAGFVDSADADVRGYVYEEIGLPMPQEIGTVPAESPKVPAPTVAPIPPPSPRVAATDPLGDAPPHEVDEATRRATAAFDRIVGPKLAGLLDAEPLA